MWTQNSISSFFINWETSVTSVSTSAFLIVEICRYSIATSRLDNANMRSCGFPAKTTNVLKRVHNCDAWLITQSGCRYHMTPQYVKCTSYLLHCLGLHSHVRKLLQLLIKKWLRARLLIECYFSEIAHWYLFHIHIYVCVYVCMVFVLLPHFDINTIMLVYIWCMSSATSSYFTKALWVVLQRW